MTEPTSYVHGVTGTTLRPKSQRFVLDAPKTPTVRNPVKLQQNNSIIEAYRRRQESSVRREEQSKPKGGIFQRLVSPVAKGVGKALEYTSGSELAYKIPGIGGDLERAADYIPGVRTALAIATNPLTYATGGVGGGLAAAAGAGAAQFAVSDRDRGLGLDLPGISEKYEETVAGAVGGLAGGASIRSIKIRNARAAVKSAEANIKRIEDGTLQLDDVMHTADNKTFFPRRPTADAPDNPLNWNSYRVKNPANFKYDPDELAWVRASAAVDDARPLGQGVVSKLASTIDEDAELIAEGVKPGKNVFEKIGDVAQQTIMPPGFKQVRKLDRAIGQSVGKLAPDAIEPVVSALARPSVALGAGALLDPQGTVDVIKKVFAIDKKIGLAVARKTLPKTDWDLGVKGLHNVNVEGIGAEVFRPTNFINFSPVGMGLKAGMRVASIAAAKQLSKRAILEGSGNAGLMGLEVWVNGGSVEDIAKGMAMGFAAGAVLPVGMDIAGHHLKLVLARVRAAQTPEEAAALAAEFGDESFKLADVEPPDDVKHVVPDEVTPGPQPGRAVGQSREQVPGEIIESTKHLIMSLKRLEEEGLVYKTYDDTDMPASMGEEIRDAVREQNNLVAEIDRLAKAGDEDAIAFVNEELDQMGRGRPDTSRAQALSEPLGDGWVNDTFDGIPRRRIEKNQYGEIWQREDGSFDFVDSRLANIKTGQTSGTVDSISNHATLEEAVVKLDDLTSRFAASPEVREQRFREDAQRALEGSEATREAEQIVRPDVVRQAEDIAAAADQPRVITEAERVIAEGVPALETGRLTPVIDRTLAEGGATFNIKSGEFLPNEGNFVGGLAPTLRVPVEDFTPEALERYVAENFDAAFSKPDVHLGTELVELIEEDGRRVVNIDAVEVVADEADALQRAATRGEERIWSADKNASINTPGVKQTQRILEGETRIKSSLSNTPWEAPEGTVTRGTKKKPSLLALDDGKTAKDIYGAAGSKAMREAIEDERVMLEELASEAGEDVSPRAQSHGARYSGGKGMVAEVGNWLPDYVKTLPLYDGAKTSQVKVLGKLLAVELKYRGALSAKEQRAWFDQQVEKYGIDWKADGRTKEDVYGRIKQQAIIEVNKVDKKLAALNGPDGKPYGIPNMARILQLIHKAGPEAGQWYESILLDTVQRVGYEDGIRFLDILAATSQQKAPKQNLRLALRAFGDYKLGLYENPNYKSPGLMGSVSDNVRAAIAGYEPLGRKINSFSQNLRLDDYAVTNDRWIFRVFGFADSEKLATGKTSKTGSPTAYEFVKGLVTRISEDLGMTPREVQARLWVGARMERKGMTVSGVSLKSTNAAYENMWAAGHVDADEESVWLRETIEKMRDDGIIDIPDRAENVSDDVQRAIEAHIEPTEKFQSEVKGAAIKKVRAEADSRGVAYTLEDDVVAIQTRLYEQEIPTGRQFTPTDAETDRNMVQARLFESPELESEIDNLIDKRPELDDFAKTGEVTPGIARAVEEYERIAGTMTDDDVITVLTIDQRTEAWQRRILEDARPEAAQRASEITPQQVIEVAKQRSVESRDFKPHYLDEAGAVRMKSSAADPAPRASVIRPLEKSTPATDTPRSQDLSEKPTTAATAEEARAYSYGTPDRRGGTAGEWGDIESTVSINALKNGIKVEGDLTVASTNPAHAAILERLAATRAIKDWVSISDRTINRIREAFKRTQLAPDSVEVSYGGNLLDRFLSADDIINTVRAQFNTTPGARGAGSGAAVIQNDILAQLYTAKVLIADNMVPDDIQDSLVRLIGKEYTEDDLLAALMTDTPFHEMVHRTIMGHKADFHNVLKAFIEESQDDFDTIFDEHAAAIAEWRYSGELDQLKELSDAANRIDRDRRTVISRPEVEPAGIRNAKSGDVQTTSGRADSSSIPEPNQGRLESGLRSRADSAKDTGTTTGADRGGTRTEGSGNGGRDTGRPVAESAPEPDRPKRPVAKVGGVESPRAQSTAEGFKKVTRKPSVAPIKDAPDLEFIETYRVASDKVSYKDAGPGKAFMEMQANWDENRLVQRLSSMEDVLEGNFIDNAMRKLGQKISNFWGGKRFVETIGGKAGTSRTPWEKAVVGYHIILGEGESRKTIALNWLKGAKNTFPEVRENGVATGKINITDVNGDIVRVNMDDVLSNPSKYKLNDAQKAYVNTTHKIIDDLVEEMRAHGIDIKELGVEKRGEHYFPRYVKNKGGDWEIAGKKFDATDANYVKRGLGQKANFQKGRYHETMAVGQKAGVIYARPEEALEVFFTQANYSIAGRKLLAEIIPTMSTTGKALALEDVGYITVKKFDKKLGREVEVKVFKPVYGATAELRKAKKAVKQAQREVEAARRGRNKSTGGTGNRKLSMRELTSMANETPEVKAAKTALEEAKRRKAANKADIDVQSPDDVKLEAAFKRAKDNYDRLLKRKNAYGQRGGHTTESPSIPKEQIAAAHQKMVDARNNLATDNIMRLGSQFNDTVAAQRAQIRAAHNIGRGANINENVRFVADANARLDLARDKFASAKRHSTQVAREMRAIIEAKSNAMTAPRSIFGLEGDILPVNAHGEVKLGRANVMGLQGKLFPDNIADDLNAAFKQADLPHIFKTLADFNNHARLARTSTDFGYLFIQGLPILAAHPVAFAKAAYQAVRALFDPEGYSRWMQTKHKTIQDMYPFAGAFTGSEYFTATKGGFIKQWADTKGGLEAPHRAARHAAGFTLQRFAVSFDAFLDASKVSMWEGMAPHMKTRADKEAYGRLLRNMTGTTDTGRLAVSQQQRAIEGLLMFSPRFTRSIFALAAMAMEGGPARMEAFKSIGMMMTAATVFYAGVKMAMYESGMSDDQFEWEDLDPSQGARFMSIKVGDNYIGLGGSMRGASQLMVNIGKSLASPERFISKDSTSNDKNNPFLKFGRGKLSPFAGTAVDLAVGKTVIGEDVSDRKAWAMRLPDQFLPFAISTVMESEGGIDQKMGALAATGVGFRQFPESGYEDLNARVKELTKDKSIEGWSSLTSVQKNNLMEKHPELQKMLDKAETQNWTKNRDLTQEYDDKKAALAARWLKTQGEHGGEKVTEDDLTSKEYRDQLEALNIGLRAARAELNKGRNSEFGKPKNARQKLMKQYYDEVDYEKFVRPDGSFDFDAKDAAESLFMSALTPEARKIVIEETAGTSTDPLEKKLKEDNTALAPYWDLRDTVAQKMGFASALEVSQQHVRVQKRYAALIAVAQQKWRRANPELEHNMLVWGRISKPISEQDIGGGKSKFGLKKRKVRRTNFGLK